MTTKLHLLIAVVVSQVILLTFVAASADNGSFGDANYPMTLHFLGVADGKSYFAEVNQTMNRDAAAVYCQASNLKLASIETQEQADMLIKVITESGLGDVWYWTSGRETRKDSMFKWNETEAPVNSSLVGRWGIVEDEYYCVQFYAYKMSPGFYAFPCSANYRPLCHT